jgi:hypothetical protein
LYGRFCPYNPPYKPGKKISTLLFSVDENIFQKSAGVVLGGIAKELEPLESIFEKCSHLREKGGVLMLFKIILYLSAKAQYPASCIVRMSCLYFTLYSVYTL